MQLNLFGPTVLATADLVAQSPKSAFYHIKIIFEDGRYRVEKRSGYGDKVLDVRKWPMESQADAEAFFRKKIAGKLKPNRKREYKIISGDYVN